MKTKNKKSAGNAIGGRKVSVRSADRDEGVDTYSLYVPPPSRGSATGKIQARVDQTHFDQIEELIATKIFRWRTPSDFIRWAIWQGVETASKFAKQPGINDVVQTVGMELVMSRSKARMADFSATLKQYRKYLAFLLGERAYRQVKTEIAMIREKTAKLQSELWREHCEKMLIEFEDLADAKIAEASRGTRARTAARRIGDRELGGVD